MSDEAVPVPDSEDAIVIHPVEQPSEQVKIDPAAPLRPIDLVRRASRLARRSLVVPEWEGMTLWFGRLTVADMVSVGEKEAPNTLERNLHLLILKTEHENGEPVFATGDLHYLRTEASFVVVQRILDFMFASAGGLPSPTEEADRIAADPSSASA